MVLNLKGVIFGTALFSIATVLYLLLRIKQINNQFPTPKIPGTYAGIEIHALAYWTYKDPLFWIMFIVTITACSFFFQVWKSAPISNP
jgi:hypothetical protein